MSKKRRTKKEKLTAAGRHDLSTLLTLPKVAEVSRVLTQNDESPKRVSAANYAYVIRDVRKTLIVITLIFLLNIVFFFILKLKFVKFPGIEF